MRFLRWAWALVGQAVIRLSGVERQLDEAMVCRLQHARESGVKSMRLRVIAHKLDRLCAQVAFGVDEAAALSTIAEEARAAADERAP